VWIHQDAWFHLGKFDEGFSIDYSIKKNGNGVYVFVLKGDITIDETV
jgi:quercetin 2,3-dioxygenase